MKRKTHTFWEDSHGKQHSDMRKLKPETLEKRGAINAHYADIDAHAPSRGYFNERKVQVYTNGGN